MGVGVIAAEVTVSSSADMLRALPGLALGLAVADADYAVREVGGANTGPRVRAYLANCEPSITVAAPWCAAAVQWWTDRAAKALGIKNPLDAVALEAYVASYYAWARYVKVIVDPSIARPGDLVFYNFRRQRWDHIGLLLKPPGADGNFEAVEGNTNSAGARDGDGVYIKQRSLAAGYDVAFARYA